MPGGMPDAAPKPCGYRCNGAVCWNVGGGLPRLLKAAYSISRAASTLGGSSRCMSLVEAPPSSCASSTQCQSLSPSSVPDTVTTASASTTVTATTANDRGVRGVAILDVEQRAASSEVMAIERRQQHNGHVSLSLTLSRR